MIDLKEAGIKVPQDVSVVGFDGLKPPKGGAKLTTIEIPFHQIGVTGGKRLLDLINKRFDSEQHILLNCDLRTGATVAKPAPQKAKAKR
jgi:DNA-binding LacI/PurR family transcriptional regulator